MNQKKAKYLRRVAEARTQGMPAISYEVGAVPKFLARRKEELNEVTGQMEATGKYIVPYIFDKVVNGVPRKLGFCTRKLYQDMKRLNT
tara:strand:+ start:385 stop:648 length:264 start_codon:yes stop_codon:yes gene_type:complete